MPEPEMHTTAFWLHFPADFLARLDGFTPTEKQSGIHGLGNALRTVASRLLMCDPRDLGVALSEDIAGELVTFEPNLYLDRKSTRLNSSHLGISYAVLCFNK